jgi:hypothetical protein
MTRDEIIALIQYRCGDRDDLTAKCLAELVELQERLEGNQWLPWFLEMDLALTTVLATEETFALPADFLLEVEDQRLWLVRSDGTKKKLEKRSLDQLKTRYAATGEPVGYCVSNELVYLRPVPELTYTFEWRYFGKAASIAGVSTETPWGKHASDLVAAELGAKIAGRHTQNPNLEAAFAGDATKAWDRLYKKHVQREEANKEQYAGG